MHPSPDDAAEEPAEGHSERPARTADRPYRLLGPDGSYWSHKPGTFGGHSGTMVYGRLDCPVALSLIRRGRFRVETRVFFADADTARACGYRPCGACLREEFRAWKAAQPAKGTPPSQSTPGHGSRRLGH